MKGDDLKEQFGEVGVEPSDEVIEKCKSFEYFCDLRLNLGLNNDQLNA